LSPASGTSSMPEICTGMGGVDFLDAIAAIVGDVADATERATRDDEVADLELALLDEQVRDGAAALPRCGLR
jgi:hypothetical protein